MSVFKKMLAMLIIAGVICGTFWIWYEEYHNAYMAVMYTLVSFIFAGVGAFLGIFVMDQFNDN